MIKMTIAAIFMKSTTNYKFGCVSSFAMSMTVGIAIIKGYADGESIQNSISCMLRISNC